ncbi:hypothetical protein TVAG_067820 [Trichomonas vaginalis G3]|uniref:Uncharacterized protein n=1 Tax=Trichomonas vaginalis (strain ATCC PRA-98 / G3) TaxID=412133 RepID=A2EMG6_TRIV3|nr:hypothetical protein TVAGG3_0499150 [Trichomonas vaginalis G3]EAY06122.1 hypothetical protein TVAG_067820 [Trichomonas vaginalis G3]KAI5516945.1 hypothetical protein TVAGG3_0499150 [Trichomonas vaginalis G3]|eukprot:XP_001318345.1 hypothetical protein [Trichomonas vaginalis G3]
MDYKPSSEATKQNIDAVQNVSGETDDAAIVAKFVELLPILIETDKISVLDEIGPQLYNCFTSIRDSSQLVEYITEDAVNGFLKLVGETQKKYPFPELSCLDHAILLRNECIPLIIQSDIFEKLNLCLQHAEELNQMDEFNIFGVVIRIIHNCALFDQETNFYIINNSAFHALLQKLSNFIDIYSFEEENKYHIHLLNYILECINTIDSKIEEIPVDYFQSVSELFRTIISNKIYQSFSQVQDFIIRHLFSPMQIFIIVQVVIECIITLFEEELEFNDENPSGNEIYLLLNVIVELFNAVPPPIILAIDEKDENAEKTKKNNDNFIHLRKYVERVTTRLDYDSIFLYAFNHKGIMHQSDSENANEAFKLLAAKSLFDCEVSADISIEMILEMCDILIDSSSLQGKDAFSAFLFSFILYAPTVILEQLFISCEVGNFIECIEGTDLKALKIIILAFDRLINVIGINNFDLEGYKFLMSSVIPEYLEDALEIQPALEWRIESLLSNFECEN